MLVTTVSPFLFQRKRLSAPGIQGNMLGRLTRQSLRAWVERLLEPILRLVVDLVAFAQVAYADGDVGHVL